MYQLASEMDFEQMATMLDALQSALMKDVPGSVHFALLLDFKCKILQICLKLWPLQRFQDILYILHPIECVCKSSHRWSRDSRISNPSDMIINSTFVVSSSQDGCEGFACLFGREIQKAYQVFSYLILWIHWKVLDPFFNDERYFETYFFSYSKSERCAHCFICLCNILADTGNQKKTFGWYRDGSVGILV